jgi:hypothetical protein
MTQINETRIYHLMMKTHYLNLSLLVLLGFSATAHARNVALVIGGGGEEQLRSASKIESSKFVDSMKKHGWETKILHGASGDSELQAEAFSRENFIGDLNLFANELKHGDRFLLNIVTEGRFANHGHELVLGDSKLVNLNESDVTKAFKTMKRNGVRIAVLDNSAYGGQTVYTLAKYGCVVTSQVPKLPSFENDVVKDKKGNIKELPYGVSSFVWKLMNGTVSDQMTMERVYLDAMVGLGKIGVFPQISGIREHNFDGENLSKMVMGLSGQLSSFKGREAKPDEVIGYDDFPHSLAWIGEKTWFTNSWVYRIRDEYRISLMNMLESLEGAERYDAKLKNLEIERQRLSDRNAGRTEAGVNDQLSKNSVRLEEVNREYRARVKQLNSKLLSVHQRNYLDMREVYGTKKLEQCQDFKLNLK